jgi:hypothetical protein
MTLTSTGPHGFHPKPLVTVFAATVAVASIIAIALWIGAENQVSSPSAVEASATIASPDVAPSANWDAYNAGKLDDTPLPPSSPAATATQPGPEAVARSSNVDAYANGKLDMELAAQNPGRYYGTTVDRTSANWVAYATGKLDDAPVAGTGADAFRETVVIVGSGGNYEALIDGKLDMEFAAQNPGLRYVTAPRVVDGTSANWAAFEAGKLDDAPFVGGAPNRESANWDAYNAGKLDDAAD